MKRKVIYILLTLIVFNTSLFAQDWADEEEQNTAPLFFAGINVGGLFVNSNTASIYTGLSTITPFGIDYILSIPTNKTIFDTYFKHPYSVSEFPQNPSYKTAFNIGLHAGINIGNKGHTIYIDINSANLKYEQSFTMVIDNPTNRSPEPVFEQIPIIGNEKRINVNLGTQISLLNKGATNIYWAFFGNFNSTKLERNFIVINNREYEIIHSSAQQPDKKPGEIGFGGGTGVGLKYKLTDRIIVDLTYNLSYIKTKMNDNIQGFGINNGIIFRVIWN